MKYRLLAGTAICCAVIIPATSAVAQTVNPEPAIAQEIIVTATRRETTLQATPLAVSAVSADTLTARGINGLGDLSNGVIPGMQLAQFSGTPSILAISARGIGISDPTQGTQELVVPIYIDGVPLGRAQGLGLELIDPERVEFLRGPQGQLFGRNAEGGAVQFVSRRPTGKFGASASAEFGSFNLNHQRLRVDLPEFANIRLQFALTHNQHDGYTKNGPKGIYSNQTDYGLLDSFGFRIAAEWNPSDRVRVNYAYDNSDTTDSQPYLHWVPVDIVGRTAFSPQPAGFNYRRQTNSPIFNEPFKTKSNGHALTAQFEASEQITLKSISSYREASRHGSSTLGDSLVVGGSSRGIVNANAREDVDQSQYYQEVQAIGSWDHFDLTVGGTYFHENVIDERRSYITGAGLTAGALGISPASLVNCVGLERCMSAHSEQNASSDSYGVYAQATYTPPILDEKLELTAGIRYSDDKKVANRTYIAPPALPPYTETQPSGVLPPSTLFKAKRWDPAFTAKYSFTSDVNVYVRYATAYRAGGANVRSSNFRPYGAEEVTSWEAGIKSRLFDRRLTLNIAAFSNRISGAQLSVQEAPTTNPSLTNTVNLPTTYRAKGIEVETTLNVAPGLNLTGSYSYLDTPAYTDIANPLAVGSPLTRFYGVQSPKHSGNVGLDFKSPDLGFGNFALHADYSFSSPYWATPGGLLVASLGPTYSRPTAKTNMMNGRISLQNIALGNTTAELAVWGKNLLDDTNYIYGFDGAASGAGFAAFINPPRTFGVELRVNF
ncbi:MAG: TonB-dependent receptor [Sphingorhabdus sp.]